MGHQNIQFAHSQHVGYLTDTIQLVGWCVDYKLWVLAAQLCQQGHLYPQVGGCIFCPFNFVHLGCSIYICKNLNFWVFNAFK